MRREVKVRRGIGTRGADLMLDAAGNKASGTVLAIASSDGALRLWSLPDLRVLGTAESGVAPLSTVAPVRADLWQGARTTALDLPRTSVDPDFTSLGVKHLALSADGSLLAGTTEGYVVGRGWPDGWLETDPELHVFSLSDGRHRRTQRLYEEATRGVATLEGFFPVVRRPSGIDTVEPLPADCRVIGPVGDRTVVSAADHDGFVLAGPSGVGDAVQLWSLPEGRPLATLRGHTGGIWALAVTPDGSLLVTASSQWIEARRYDVTVRLWSLPEGRSLATVEAQDCWARTMAIVPAGHALAIACGETVHVWSVAEGRSLGTLEGHPSPIATMAATPDGSVLACASHGPDRHQTYHRVTLWRSGDHQRDWP